MSQPYIGEIRLFAGSFAPQGWLFCDGSELPISEYDTFFTVIGTTYGGDGQSTFAVPDLRGRVPVHQGAGVALAERAGSESVTLSVQQIPAHSHPVLATTTNANDANCANNMLAQPTTFDAYQSSANPGPDMAPQAVTPVGGSQPHENMMPFLTINYIISPFGIFPSQT